MSRSNQDRKGFSLVEGGRNGKRLPLAVGLAAIAVVFVLAACGGGAEPAAAPTDAPLAVQPEDQVAAPTDAPAAAPTAAPTAVPTAVPTLAPAVEPTAAPAVEPTAAPTAAPTVEPTPPVALATDEAEVEIEDFAFNPRVLEIRVGTTVKWSNKDDVTHTATSDTGVWDSGSLSKGEDFFFTFTEPGTYPYYCRPHGGPGGVGMSGTVVVVE